MRDFFCRWCGRWYTRTCPWKACRGHNPYADALREGRADA
jgi:hypothetical protein